MKINFFKLSGALPYSNNEITSNTSIEISDLPMKKLISTKF